MDLASVKLQRRRQDLDHSSLRGVWTAEKWIGGVNFVMIRLDEVRTVGLIFNKFSWS